MNEEKDENLPEGFDADGVRVSDLDNMTDNEKFGWLERQKELETMFWVAPKLSIVLEEALKQALEQKPLDIKIEFVKNETTEEGTEKAWYRIEVEEAASLIFLGMHFQYLASTFKG